jgi:diguanylate cyclase (GGDEF)-like protein
MDFVKMLEAYNDLIKMDPKMANALAAIRRAGLAEHANTVARGLYTDTMIPTMGNKMAYNDFLTRNENRGVHVHVDMNDFGQINKFHGEKVGDHAIKRFGSVAQEVSRQMGGKSFRNGGDEFKFWFHKPEHAHAFARTLRDRLEKEPKVGSNGNLTHNLAASIGIGYNPNHAETALLHAKKQLGPTDAVTGKRTNKHSVGNAPTVVHSLTHEVQPQGWAAGDGKITGSVKTANLAPPGLSFHNPLEKKEDTIQTPGVEPTHPALSGKRVGMLTAQDPHWPVQTSGENYALEQELKQRGLKFEKIKGRYATDENSFLIHDPDLDSMRDLGKRYGQDSVLYSDGGKHKLVYTNGPHDGMYHPGEGHIVHPHEPERYFSTVIHNGQPQHFTFNIDFDQLHPVDPTSGTPKLQHETPASEYPQKREVMPHPNNYEWHDGHTSHHLAVVAKSDNVPGNPSTPEVKPVNNAPANDQAAGVGVPTYAKFAQHYGTVTPGTKTDLKHYDYRPVADKVDKMVAHHGYQTFIAGGKYGKPDLGKRNYNTKHLMIYDPTPSSGGDFQDELYTKTWRTVHELAHALTYDQLNAKYGEGRRIGKLGIHRTPREAKRAVEWEWLAAHKQRELGEQMGLHVPDEVFHKELNTTMHDAVHRAVTGQFTEPSDEGFAPFSHKVPLETALGMIDDEARKMGIPHDNALAPRIR